MRLQIVGGGKMGEALLGGLLARSWAAPEELVVVEPVEERRRELSARFPGLGVAAAPVPTVDAVLAVKPDVVAQAGTTLRDSGVRRVLSIAAGVTVERLESALGPEAAVIRAMPNTPALVGEGAAAIAGGSRAGSEDLDWARSILESVGSVATVPEEMLDAVTGLSGSGPAYVFLLAEALIRAGENAGLPHEISDALTRQTLFGAATLLMRTGEDPAILRRNVTSPGGTTAAGLEVLESAGLREVVDQAVRAAAQRARELGQG